SSLDTGLRAEAARLTATSSHAEQRKCALDLLLFDSIEVRQKTASGWAQAADCSRQCDIPVLLSILQNVRWLSEPTPEDLDTYETIQRGIVRTVEDGGFIDNTFFESLHALGLQTHEKVWARTKHTLDTLSKS